MKTTMRREKLAILCLLSLTCLVFGSASEVAALDLDINSKQVQKKEVRHSQIGYRSTLLFYTFTKDKAVLRLNIGNNKDKTFPVTTTIYLFDKSVTEEGLKKWLNNQYSDGLFPDIPEPTKTIQVPAKGAKVTSFKLIDKSTEPFGKYDNYEVQFEVKEHKEKDTVTLKAFEGKTKVHIKTL